MADDTCSSNGCAKPTKIRGLCGLHYGRALRNGTLEQVAAPPKNDSALFHRLSGVDAKSNTGTCSICGPVRVRVRSGGRGAQCWTLRRRDRQRKNPEASRRAWVLWRYELTADELDALIARAKGCCEICGAAAPFDDGAAVDHCHESGRVRGLLCRRCNVALGWFEDDPARLLAAHLYLKASKGG